MSKEKILKEFDELSKTLIDKPYETVAILKNKILLSNAIDNILNDIEKEIPQECEHSEYCEYSRDKKMPCDCNANSWNHLVKEVKSIINSKK